MAGFPYFICQHCLRWVTSVLFIAHLHRHIRKAISGKKKRYSAAFFQLIFTFILSLYSYFFLYVYQSIIPSILLHAYCNYLGPPIIKGSNIYIKFRKLFNLSFTLYDFIFSILDLYYLMYISPIPYLLGY